ncbi:hypothetical protein [Streptomyces carpinensis]|uniref:hypothetical protein n=1 Tax=Streptomyces carpinensis TaxID=66369 RepID=UPI003CC69820
MVALAAAIVLIPRAPLGLITTAVQALAGLLLPSASVFLLLLCNDRAVLGPWVNPRWLNTLAAVIIAVLLTLSGSAASWSWGFSPPQHGCASSAPADHRPRLGPQKPLAPNARAGAR